jgi:sulfur carrier protein
MSAEQSPTRQAVTVTVNGDSTVVIPGCTIDGLLEALGMAGRRVAVAVNRDVVPRSRYGAVVLAADDCVEILEAVGGG